MNLKRIFPLILGLSYLGLILFFIFSPPPKDCTLKSEPALTAIGTPTNEFDELLARVIEDTKLPNARIKVFKGHYFRYAGITAMLDISDAPNYFMFLDAEFLTELTPEEKIAEVVHEASHILFISEKGFNREQRTAIEIRADQFTTRYVHPKHILSSVNKAYLDHTKRARALEILEQKWSQ